MSLKIAVFVCPSDEQAPEVRDTGAGKPRLYATTYGFNQGTWFVYDPVTKKGGDGVFYPNSFLRMAQIEDGTSKTLLAAEVKAWTHYTRNGRPPRAPRFPTRSRQPATNVAVGCPTTRTRATPNGRTAACITPVSPRRMPPNTFVPYDGEGRVASTPITIRGRKAKAGLRVRTKTYAIITSRSYHPGGVQVAMVDGSGQTMSRRHRLLVWRAKATRAGGETFVD